MAFTVHIDIGQGPRAITLDPEDITLGFLEDLEEARTSGRWRPLRTAIASLLSLSAEESRAVTMRQFKQIAAALSGSVEEQNADPKGT